MTPDIFTNLIEKSLTVAILVFIVIYFMKQMDKKDTTNQQNLDKFILLVEKSNEIHTDSKNAFATMTQKMEALNSDINQ